MPSREVLFERMPARPRVLAECLLVVTLFFFPATLLVVPGTGIWYALGAGFVGWGAWALALTYRRPLPALAAGAGVAGMLWSTQVRAPQSPPRLGILPRDGAGCVEVTRTIPGTPADGRLLPRDCITAIAGKAIDRARLQPGGGLTIAPDGDTVRLYYGAADTSIALATGSVDAMLHWLEQE